MSSYSANVFRFHPSVSLPGWPAALARIGTYKSNTTRKRIEVRYLHYNRQQVAYRKERQKRNRVFSTVSCSTTPVQLNTRVQIKVHRD